MLLAGDFAPNGHSVVLPARMKGVTLLANLESPIIDETPLPPAEFKSGPSLCSSGLGLRSDNATKILFSLANNHIMDYGVAGLAKTMRNIDSVGIKYGGAGFTASEARKPIVINDDGLKIGIICCREAQFGSRNCADFGWWVFDTIKELKSQVDRIVVSAHAAAEDLSFPSPAICRLYRRFIDAGADVVHGHHSHVPQGWESYRHGLIFYGMGNFVVDPSIWPDFINRWSLVADVDFSSEMPSVCLIQCECTSDGHSGIAVRECGDATKEARERYLKICSHALSDEKLSEGYWQEVACRLYEKTYGGPLCHPSFKTANIDGTNRIHFIAEGVRKIAEGLLGRRFPSSRTIGSAANVYNCTQCLSHSEMIKTAMGVALGNVEDRRTSEISSDCKFIASFLDG